MARRRKRSATQGLVIPPCNWPHCPCHDRHQTYLEIFERWHAEGIPPMTDEVKDDVLLSVTCLLACIAHNCCDLQVREFYKKQLLRPVFDEHRGPWQNN
jgi:hypothetical protein